MLLIKDLIQIWSSACLQMCFPISQPRVMLSLCLHIKEFQHIFVSKGYAYKKSALREKCPNTEFFLVRIFVYSYWIQEDTDQKNPVIGHFSRSGAVRHRQKSSYYGKNLANFFNKLNPFEANVSFLYLHF